MKEKNQMKMNEATEIIELACEQLELLTRSFDCIAQVLDSGQLKLVSTDNYSTESVN